MSDEKKVAFAGQIGPVPVKCVAARVRIPSTGVEVSKTYVTLRIETPVGAQFYFLDPAYALEVGETLRMAALDIAPVKPSVALIKGGL